MNNRITASLAASLLLLATTAGCANSPTHQNYAETGDADDVTVGDGGVRAGRAKPTGGGGQGGNGGGAPIGGAMGGTMGGAMGGTMGAAMPPQEAVSEKLVPARGAWWGASVVADASIRWDWQRAFKDFEAKAERKLDIWSRYHDWGSTDNGLFPDQYEQAQLKEGTILHVNWATRQFTAGNNITWTEIKDGMQDEVIDAAIQRVKAAGARLMIGFDQEMEEHKEDGPDSHYAAAYRYIVQRFRNAGVTNVVWVWSPAGWKADWARLSALYPGDAYVDWLGYSAYNFYSCNNDGWVDPLARFRAFYEWMHEPAQMAWHGSKPYMLSEFSSHEDSADPARKGQWMRGVINALKALPDLKAAQFHYWVVSLSGGACSFQMDSSPQALQGYVAAGRDPYVNQPHQ